MNVLEYELIDLLKKLKNEYGVFEIKAEYENEGSRQVELMRLKDIASAAGLPIILKIGGVEAVTDIYNALSLGVKGIVAPMAETAYALSKFLNAIDTFVPPDNQKDIEFAANIETITAYHNIEEILSLDDINLMSSITIGRVDFTGSMGAERSFANSDEMLKICTDIFQKAKQKGLKTAMGGEISPKAESFIKNLTSKELLDKYETRKLVYHESAIETITEGLSAGIKFELLWLKSKRRYYHRVRNEDEKRIEMLEKRFSAS
ncbi:aldolase/citrate lyase family protein [Desulfococcaceae bacterium HSG7]|nr:aldolase/citrate lyase family protein [Desulfococcaceae bacterium HSG7]